jgi:hypothetical protein
MIDILALWTFISLRASFAELRLSWHAMIWFLCEGVLNAFLCLRKLSRAVAALFGVLIVSSVQKRESKSQKGREEGKEEGKEKGESPKTGDD